MLSQHLAVLAEQHGWPLIYVGAHPGNAATDIAASGPRMGGSPSRLFRVAWRITPQHDATAGAAARLWDEASRAWVVRTVGAYAAIAGAASHAGWPTGRALEADRCQVDDASVVGSDVAPPVRDSAARSRE
jgi:hypothetical protein